jgi:hypothetical protein
VDDYYACLLRAHPGFLKGHIWLATTHVITPEEPLQPPAVDFVFRADRRDRGRSACSKPYPNDIIGIKRRKIPDWIA